MSTRIITLRRAENPDGQWRTTADCLGINTSKQLVSEAVEKLLPMLEAQLGFRIESEPPEDDGWFDVDGDLWAISEACMLRRAVPLPSMSIDWIEPINLISRTPEPRELVRGCTIGPRVEIQKKIRARSRNVVELARSDGSTILVNGNLLRNLLIDSTWSQATGDKEAPIQVRRGGSLRLAALIMPISDHSIALTPEDGPWDHWPISMVLRPHPSIACA